MERIERMMNMPDAQFKRIIGTTKPVFQEMLEITQTAYCKLHLSGGKPPKLSCGDKLLIALQYYREYRTMEHIAVDYGVSKSSVHRSVVWVENVLSADRRFQLPGKDALLKDNVEVVAVDVTEHPIERPQKKREEWYSGKKKRHTVKGPNHCG